MPPSEKKNRKRGFQYIAGGFLVFFLAYHSVYFKKLDEVKAAADKKFDTTGFAKAFLITKLIPKLDSAIDINTLLRNLATDKDKTFDTYSHATAIGSIRYFLIKGEGVISSINENDVLVQTNNNRLSIATEFIYGNALRDASGSFDIAAFTNTADINSVSSELNKIIRTTVASPFKVQAKVGDKIQFGGAVEFNRERLNIETIEVIPASLKINN